MPETPTRSGRRNRDRTDHDLGVEIRHIEDGPDLRDLYYQPSLQPLPAGHFPDHLELESATPRIEIRNQQSAGHCTGYALAALIDILHRDSRKVYRTQPDPPAVSARMLFEMGRLVSRVTTGAGDRRLSIRSAIKGFYHNGVCSADDWPDEDGGILNVNRAQAARRIGLGAYYRLAQYLPDYHAALRDVDGILVSAKIHDGWRPASVREAGHIRLENGDHGAHAFVIVGYDDTGFYVLNSLGADWGGRRRHGLRGGNGFAHWSYEDWSRNVIDAWVLRLSVPTPKAFDFSIGPQGQRYGHLAGREPGGADAATALAHRATPRRAVLGHYLHWFDGGFMSGGSYPDSEKSLETTLEHLTEKLSGGAGSATSPVERVYLRLTGDAGDVKDAMHRVALLRRSLRPRGIYPLSVVWCAELVSAFRTAVSAGMQAACERMPDPSEARDQLIQTQLRPIGRALWKQMQHEARELGRSSGPLWSIVDALDTAFEARKRYGHRSDPTDRGGLDIVAEGAGALLIAAMLKTAGRDAALRLRHVRKIQLLFPAVRTDELAAAIRGLDAGTSRCRELRQRILVHLPRPELLDNLSVGAYTKSWFHLVNYSFDADRIGDTDKRILALAGKHEPTLRRLDVDTDEFDGPELNSITRTPDAHHHLRSLAVSDAILGRVLDIR